MEVRIVRNDHGTYDVESVPAPIFDVETERPLRNDRGVIVYSKPAILKNDFGSEEEAREWAEENEHGVIE